MDELNWLLTDTYGVEFYQKTDECLPTLLSYFKASPSRLLAIREKHKLNRKYA